MPNQDEAKRKLLILAIRAKGGITTGSEDLQIIRAVEAGRIKNRADVSRVLEESLNKTAGEIHTTFASDDGDRLVDEIVSLLED